MKIKIENEQVIIELDPESTFPLSFQRKRESIGCVWWF